MKFRIRPKKLIVPAVNALAVAGIVFTSVAGMSAAKSQRCNFTAEKWKGDSKEDYSQLSCFFSEDAGFGTGNIRSVRGQILSELKDAAYDIENADTLFVDAYSGYAGEAKVKGDISGRANAQITAVGGDFFYFHDFELVNGAYFTEKDTMQDGAVIDRTLAWLLYGSDDVAGMNIYINGVKCYIAGVVKDPSNKTEKRCAGKAPKAYVTYDTASAMLRMNEKGGRSEMSDKFTRVTDYECVLPEPVENFGSNTFKKIFAETYSGNSAIVENSKRFTAKNRTKAFRHLSDAVVRNDGIRLPYWENTSRVYEFKASVYYGIRKYLFIIPIITLICLAYKGTRAYNNHKKTIKNKIINFAEEFLQKRRAKPTAAGKE